jgi:uncharacterized protein (TIGR02453 family)
MIGDFLAFMAELENNNNKLWFEANRPRYKKLYEEYKVWIGKILQRLIEIDPQLQFLLPKNCLFRINRDVRFSNDKSPYKNHLSGFFSPNRSNDHTDGYYLEIKPDGKMFVAAGQYSFEPKELLRIRTNISKNENNIAEELELILKDKKFQKYFPKGLAGDKLKTHPKGFTKEDQYIEILKYKNYIISNNFEVGSKSDQQIIDHILPIFAVSKPLIDWIRKISI